jgi:hypothetical protein
VRVQKVKAGQLKSSGIKLKHRSYCWSNFRFFWVAMVGLFELSNKLLGVVAGRRSANARFFKCRFDLRRPSVFCLKQ